MATLRLLPAFLVAYLFLVAQVSGGKSSSEEQVSEDKVTEVKVPEVTVSVSYDGVFSITPVKGNLAALRSTLVAYRTSVRDFTFTVPKTPTIAELGKVVKDFSLKASGFLIYYVEALENIVATGNVPSREVFGQFAKPNFKLKKFLNSDGGVFTRRLNELIGCPPSRAFKNIFKNLDHQIEFIALAIHRIKEAVESGKDKRDYVDRQATIISNRVVKLSEIVEKQLADSIIQLTQRIQTANGFTSTVLLTNNTLLSVEGALNTTAEVAATLSNATLGFYTAGQLGVVLDLSTSIGKLSAYKQYKKLRHLAQAIEDAYNTGYHHLHKQNQSDSDQIKKSFVKALNNTKGIVNNATGVFLDAAQQTVLEFIDFFLEGRLSDKCVADFIVPIADTYVEFTTNVGVCLSQEAIFFGQTIEAFNCSVGVLKTSTNSIAASLARCASYESCSPPPPPPPPPPAPVPPVAVVTPGVTPNATTPTNGTFVKNTRTDRALDCLSGTNPTADALAFARIKACLKTNLRDMHLLGGILKAQFEHVVRPITLGVDTSAFRLNNCLGTWLHELIAKLKTLRVQVRACSTRIDECPLVKLCDDDDDSGECQDSHGSHGKTFLEKGDEEQLKDE